LPIISPGPPPSLGELDVQNHEPPFALIVLIIK
jgi:hypothetical protein